MDYVLTSSISMAVLLLALSVPDASAMQCNAVLHCPNIITKAFDAITDADNSKSYCCHPKSSLVAYCCDWMDYAAYSVGLDPNNLAIPVGAIVGIVVGGVVLLLLLSVCCCFCCACCCFRGRKRTVTTHSTVAYVANDNAVVTTLDPAHFSPAASAPTRVPFHTPPTKHQIPSPHSHHEFFNARHPPPPPYNPQF